MKKGRHLGILAYNGMELSKLVGVFYQKKSTEFVTKKKMDYTGMMVYQFLETKNVPNQKYRTEIDNNLKIVDYLDIALNLKDGTFRPYHTLDDKIQHTHDWIHWEMTKAQFPTLFSFGYCFCVYVADTQKILVIGN